MTMRFFIFLALLLTSQMVLSDGMLLPILKVVDGDTIETELNLPPPLNKVYIRIIGIDTPESNFLAKCEKEYQHGNEAKEFLKFYLKDKKTMIVKNYKWDKYGGRIDGIVYIDDINLNDLMISRHYALPYTGQGQKPDWCSILN